MSLMPKTQNEGLQEKFDKTLTELRRAVLNNEVSSVDETWKKLTNAYKNAASPLIKLIATRIREEGKKNFLHSTGDLYISGIEQGLSKAFSMLKSIILYEYPQFTKLIAEIEKDIEY